MEYLATVVEFDAWDKLDKDWTSNVALRNMTPDNVSMHHDLNKELAAAPMQPAFLSSTHRQWSARVAKYLGQACFP